MSINHKALPYRAGIFDGSFWMDFIDIFIDSDFILRSLLLIAIQSTHGARYELRCQFSFPSFVQEANRRTNE